MSNILAIDTSAHACSVTLAYAGQLTSLHQLVERQQAALILSMVDQLLQQSVVKLNQLDAIAFSAGPGSFTGTRLSASVVQGLAFGADLPVIPVSSLQVLAQGAYVDWQAKNVLVAINAYVEEVYWGVYQLNAAGLMQPVMTDQRCRPEAVVVPFIADWTGIGEGWAVYAQLLQQQIPAVKHIHNTQYPHARDVASLAVAKFSLGEFLTPAQASPNYLYDAEQWRK